MKRRTLIAGVGLAVLPVRAWTNSGWREIELNRTHLRFWHENRRLHAQFGAPTDGWLAVGFNNEQVLEGTRFVIGAMKNGSFHAEKHIVVGPGHPTVQSLGYEATVTGVTGEVTATHSTMAFSLPHVFPDTSSPSLSPGKTTHLMLACSQDANFSHHSAWRRHLDITL
ncbi:DOMON domain-containing protein [uncultured Roseobacter sp.]|uniref:DOMON domain-containing protein n=1 Tax=uncultured Roseobacter sp. TaxID=114847 RepID=UPI0026164A29|nr:DOMON domain-containing protein [uncultured Roseobacter sp.]